MTYHDTRVELPLELQPPRVEERLKGSGVFVRLSDSYLHCIVYLGWPIAGSEDEIDPIGTGFLVLHDGATYIVTAAHVALRFSQDNLPFAIRLHKTESSGLLERIDSADKWFFHPDNTIDVAVMQYVPPAWAQGNAYPFRNVITDFKKETKNIGPGDQAYVVGIFKLLPGAKRNNPVVHTGHVASMAEGEEIETLDWRSTAQQPPALKINGYIIQVQTMPQASGSPVFVRRSLLGYTTHTPNKALGHESQRLSSGIYGSVWLLGIWHGAWTDDISKYLRIAKDTVTLNVGMGITIPAPRIIETLDQPELIAMRQTEKARPKGPTVVPQSVSRTAAKAGDAILLAALRTPPVPQKKPKAKTVKRARAGVNSK